MSEAYTSHVMSVCALGDVLAEIKEKRGVEFAAPSGIAFGADDGAREADELLRARPFDWRARVIVTSGMPTGAGGVQLHFSVTYKNKRGLDTNLWFKSPPTHDIAHLPFFAWALFALLEAELVARKVPGVTPAKYSEARKASEG